MTLVRGRIVSAVNAKTETRTVKSVELLAPQPQRTQNTQVLPAFRVRAFAEGNALLLLANAKAEALLAAAQRDIDLQKQAVLERAHAEARAALAAEFLVLSAKQASLLDASLDKLADLALLVAERVIGETLAMDPTKVRGLAEQALRATQGAAEVRIDAHSDDVVEVERLLSELAHVRARVVAAADLSRGSLVLHTNLGTVDARLSVQLELLRTTLRGIVRG
jgi:flagellar biosynthesis/type III secretory pathway protein FliH